MRTSMKPDEAFGMIFDLEGTASWMNSITLLTACAPKVHQCDRFPPEDIGL